MCLGLVYPDLGGDALAKSPDEGVYCAGDAPKISIVSLHAQRLADYIHMIIAVSFAFLRKRWAHFDTVYAGATGLVFELLPVAFGVFEYWGSGRRCAES